MVNGQKCPKNHFHVSYFENPCFIFFFSIHLTESFHFHFEITYATPINQISTEHDDELSSISILFSVKNKVCNFNDLILNIDLIVFVGLYICFVFLHY